MHRLMMLIVLMLMSVRFTFAQVDIPTHTEIEQMYPAGIGFIIDIGVPFSQIEAATLTFSGENIERQEIEIDLSAAQILPESPEAPEGVILPSPTPSNTTRLGYAWALSLDNLPRLFSEMTYTWDIEVRNRPRMIAEGTFTFRDPRFNWVHHSNGGLNIAFAEIVANSTAINGELRSIYTTLSNVTRANIPINLIVYPEGVTPNCDQRENFFFARAYFLGEDFPCSPQVAEAVLRQSDFFALTSPSRASLRTLLAGWLIDHFLTDYWSNTAMPLWFRESVKRFFSVEDTASTLSVSRTIVRSNQQLTLSQMLQTPSASNRTTWDAQAYSMMLYIVDSIGVEGLYSLMQASSRDFDARYEDAMGEPLSRILINWQRWLFTPNAEVANGVSPYQLATVIPSATPTLTYTPTLTSTLPPSNTPPPTDMLMPTLTPSYTPTQALPTNTPRSASDLFTPTPIPPTNPSTNISSITQSIVIAILMILIALAIVAFIRIGKR